MMQPHFSCVGFTLVKNKYNIHAYIGFPEGFIPYKTTSNYKRPKLPLMTKGGGKAILGLFTRAGLP